MLGGACVTEEVWPGYRVSTASYVMSLLQPKIIRELELRKFGFEVLPTDNLFVPFPDGRYFVYWDDTKKTCAEIAKFSRKDAETYPVFEHFLHDAAKFVRELLWTTPPNPASRRPGEIKELIALLWKFRKLGNRIFRFVDLMTESISDFLDRYFESDQVKAVLAYYGSIGTFAGPRTPGTAYVLLHHLMGEHEGAGGWGFIRGGMGGISLAIARSAERHGARIRADAEVARITVRDGRAAGVVLASGEEIAARMVVSNADPRRTFLGMVGAGELPADFVEEVRTYKTYSTAFKINLALDEAPRYTAFDAEARSGPPTRPTSTSAPASSTWSAPTTTRSTAGRRPGPSSRRSCRRSSTRTSRQRASTSSTSSAATRPTRSRAAPGTRSASASPTPSSTRWRSTRRISRAP